MVLLDMMHTIDPARTRVFTIDTGRLHQETYDLMDRVRTRYEIGVEVYFPRAESVEAMVREHGLNLFYDSVALRQKCCGVRKVEPLERALADLDAWIAGLRPDQSVTRGDVRAVEIDEVHGGRIKLNPLVRWTREDVMAYVERNHVPVNRLHDAGLSERRLRAVHPLDPARRGRTRRTLVVGERRDQRECGIHVGYEEKGSGI